MIRNLILIVFSLSCFLVFPQRKRVNIDSVIKADNYNVYKNISYGPDRKNTLDLWIADSKSNSPFVIYIHGGGFGAGSKNAAYSTWSTKIQERSRPLFSKTRRSSCQD